MISFYILLVIVFAVVLRLYSTFPARAPKACFSYVKSGHFMFAMANDELFSLPPDTKPYLITLNTGAVLPSTLTKDEVQVIIDQVRVSNIIGAGNFWKKWYVREVDERVKRMKSIIITS
jgi:hypothetical protein